MCEYHRAETTWGHTTDTDVTRSYIIIPASASARLAHDIMMGRSPEMKQLQVRSSIVARKLMQKAMVTEERFPSKLYKYTSLGGYPDKFQT